MGSVSFAMHIVSKKSAIQRLEYVFKDALMDTGSQHVTESVIQNAYLAVRQMDRVHDARTLQNMDLTVEANAATPVRTPIIETEAETQTSSRAVFVGGFGGGAAALAAILVVGLILLRRRKVNLRNQRQTPETEPENLSALNETVKKARPSQADYANDDTDNLHSVTIIENTNYLRSIQQSPKVPYGLLKSYEVSQTKFNMHRNRYKGIYPYDDTRVIVRGGETDYINASYIDGFRKRNAYIAALGPMAKQLGDFGQFWRMVWQQKVEKIVMVTNLVEGEKTKCEQYWPGHGQSKLYGDTEVVCKVEKLYADFIWRQFTLSKDKHNFEERNLHHLQFTAWPDKDIPDNVTSIIEFRQKVNALPRTFHGPVIVHC
ncbi:PTPRC-like protein, partial [Mya arenaria]